MKLVAIRHLPTAYNQGGLLQGKLDIPLLEPDFDMRKKICRNVVALSTHEFDVVVTSQLKRTQQTAELHGYESYRIDHLADELDFGVYEGRPKKDLIEHFAAAWSNDISILPLGESHSKLLARIEAFFDAYSHCANVLLFGHGAWLRAARALLIHKDINQMNHWFLAPGDRVSLQWPAKS